MLKYLCAVWDKAIDQSVTVTEESVELWGSLNRRGSWEVELLPLNCHRTAAWWYHAPHLRFHLQQPIGNVSCTCYTCTLLTWWLTWRSWSEAHLLSPGVLCLCVKKLISSSTCLSQRSQHVTISCQATRKHNHIIRYRHTHLKCGNQTPYMFYYSQFAFFFFLHPLVIKYPYWIGRGYLWIMCITGYPLTVYHIAENVIHATRSRRVRQDIT